MSFCTERRLATYKTIIRIVTNFIHKLFVIAATSDVSATGNCVFVCRKLTVSILLCNNKQSSLILFRDVTLDFALVEHGRHALSDIDVTVKELKSVVL